MKTHRNLFSIILTAFLILIANTAWGRAAVPAEPQTPATGATTRVSIASDGTQGNFGSSGPSISTDGQYVAFHSYASNLVSGDTNARKDIFLHVTQAGQTSRVSVASDGTQGNAGSGDPFISADGRYVAFDSYASNLVSGDTNGTQDVFVHDLSLTATPSQKIFLPFVIQ